LNSVFGSPNNFGSHVQKDFSYAFNTICHNVFLKAPFSLCSNVPQRDGDFRQDHWLVSGTLPLHVYLETLTRNPQPEFAHPYHQLKQVADIIVASPAGGAAPVDQGSVDNWKKDEVCRQVWETESRLWKNTKTLSTFLGKAKDFAGVFYVGGHGRKSFLLR
jgi:hypothetical protein